MKSDLYNPFSKSAEVHLKSTDRTMISIQLRILAAMTENWLDDIQNSVTPLTAAFNRSCRGKLMRHYINATEVNLDVASSPADTLEKRILAIAGVAAHNGYKEKRWNKLVPKLQAIVDATARAPTKPGAYYAARTARSALRGFTPKGVTPT